MPNEAIDFAAHFAGLTLKGQTEQTRIFGCTRVRFLRLLAGAGGRWGSHHGAAQTLIVWTGAVDVEFRTSMLHLGIGQCCVIAAGAEYRWSSQTGAEFVVIGQIRAALAA